MKIKSKLIIIGILFSALFLNGCSNDSSNINDGMNDEGDLGKEDFKFSGEINDYNDRISKENEEAMMYLIQSIYDKSEKNIIIFSRTQKEQKDGMYRMNLDVLNNYTSNKGNFMFLFVDEVVKSSNESYYSCYMTALSKDLREKISEALSDELAEKFGTSNMNRYFEHEVCYKSFEGYKFNESALINMLTIYDENIELLLY